MAENFQVGMDQRKTGNCHSIKQILISENHRPCYLCCGAYAVKRHIVMEAAGKTNESPPWGSFTGRVVTTS